MTLGNYVISFGFGVTTWLSSGRMSSSFPDTEMTPHFKRGLKNYKLTKQKDRFGTIFSEPNISDAEC